MVNIGLIGVGIMGTNHLRVLSNLNDVNVSISDVDKDKCEELAKTAKVKSYYFDHKEMLDKEELDGVVVAVPSAFHKQIVLDCIEKGVNILVEKPIAHSLEDAQLMIDKANEKGVLLTVGHTERFNPVITKIKEFIDEGRLGKIYLVNSVRIGPFPKRLYGLQEGVLIDLSVHDVDIIRYLVGDIREVHSQMIFSGKQEIYARSLFKIDGDTMGSAEFSWVSPRKRRTIELFGIKGILRGDYINQELTFYENSDESEAALEKGTISEGKIIKYPIYKQEPLKLELEHFIDCIKNNKQPLVTSEDAKKALKVALSIYESGKDNKSVNI